MKESYAAVLTGFESLGADDSRERPVDRLGALGAAQIRRAEGAAREAVLCTLGKDLIAFKGANRASAKADAEDMLAALLATYNGLGIKARERLIIARQAVLEFAIDFCPTCNGARVVPDQHGLEGAQPTSDCGTCRGTGKRRYTDEERAAVMGKPHGKAMGKAHELLAVAVDLAERRAGELLEHWPLKG